MMRLLWKKKSNSPNCTEWRIFIFRDPLSFWRVLVRPPIDCILYTKMPFLCISLSIYTKVKYTLCLRYIIFFLFFHFYFIPFLWTSMIRSYTYSKISFSWHTKDCALSTPFQKKKIPLKTFHQPHSPHHPYNTSHPSTSMVSGVQSCSCLLCYAAVFFLLSVFFCVIFASSFVKYNARMYKTLLWLYVCFLLWITQKMMKIKYENKK